MYSIVIPARNEEEYLPRCLASIESASGLVDAEFEVIVVLNRCEDRTEQIAREAGCRLIREDAKNLSTIRNAGAFAAKGEVIITIDADSYVPRKLLRRIDRCLQKDRVIGGGTIIVPDRWSLGIALTFLCIVPVALYYGISAGLFFCRREAFLAIGGFDKNWVSIEDIDFARRLRSYARSQGKIFKNLYTSYIVTSTRKFDAFGDWYFIRNPGLVKKLFTGRDQGAANQVWYDVDR